MTKLLLVASLLVALVAATPVKIQPALERSLLQNGVANVFINLEPTTQVTKQLKSAKFNSRAERKSVVANSLKRHAQKSQASVLEFLATQSDITVHSFWISNQVYVQNANTALVHALARRPDVLSIREEIKSPKIYPVQTPYVPSAHAPNAIEWGLERIGVQPVWDSGINGTGIRVGILDTGVLPTHEALRDNYVGEYGWFAPLSKTEYPEDSGGHGTHVMGTILGQGGIGVAPGAQWMACQNIPGGEREDLACGQFMSCPHLPDGSNPDCTQAPDVVSNSWGYPAEGVPFFDPVFEAWDAAGIVPIFSAGNNGPGCATGGSPGDSAHPALVTVGATDIDEKLASFSSRGPSRFDVIKPNIAAPGVDVRSSCTGHDSDYCFLSGTSMAAPHVAGVVALMFSAEPSSSSEDIRTGLYNDATHTVAESVQNCGDIPGSSYPNNHVGHGRLSASSAISLFAKN